MEWIDRKIKLQPLHKLAIFFWPKFSQLPMLTAADRSRVHEDARGPGHISHPTLMTRKPDPGMTRLERGPARHETHSKRVGVGG